MVFIINQFFWLGFSIFSVITATTQFCRWLVSIYSDAMSLLILIYITSVCCGKFHWHSWGPICRVVLNPSILIFFHLFHDFAMLGLIIAILGSFCTLPASHLSASVAATGRRYCGFQLLAETLSFLAPILLLFFKSPVSLTIFSPSFNLLLIIDGCSPS